VLGWVGVGVGCVVMPLDPLGSVLVQDELTSSVAQGVAVAEDDEDDEELV
jgi:hypothetical protein